MDVGLVNPFLSATVDILSKVANITTDVQKPFVKSNLEGTGVISGLVTLKGNHTGTGAVTFSRNCILLIVSKMFGETITEVDDDVKDAVGEITNMISGMATQLYEQNGLALKTALDQVLVGEKHTIPHLPECSVLGIPIKTDMGDILVELCFKDV